MGVSIVMGVSKMLGLFHGKSHLKAMFLDDSPKRTIIGGRSEVVVIYTD